jgi:hypothetical protein
MFMLLIGCGIAGPQRSITGTIETTRKIGGAVCPLLITEPDGTRWEVTLPDGYVMDITPEGDEPRSGLIGPDGDVIAPLGGTVEIKLTDHVPSQSVCRWGTPVLAGAISAP